MCSSLFSSLWENTYQKLFHGLKFILVCGVRRISVCNGWEGTGTEGAQPSSSRAGAGNSSCTMDQEAASTGLEDAYKTLVMIKKKKKSIRRGKRSQKFDILTIYLCPPPPPVCLPFWNLTPCPSLSKAHPLWPWPNLDRKDPLHWRSITSPNRIMGWGHLLKHISLWRARDI